MRRLFFVIACSLGWLAGLAYAQDRMPTLTHDRLLQERTVEVSVIDEQRSVKEYRDVFEALTRTGAQELTTRVLRFQQGSQELEILAAYTQKPDARRLDVRVDLIEKQSGVLGGNLDPSFPNASQWLLRFPDVQPGDRTVLHYRIKTLQAPLPGWHYEDWWAGDPFETRHLHFVLHAPLSLPWHVHARGMDVTHLQQDGQDLWDISGRLPAGAPDRWAVNVLADAPGVAAATFAGPEAVGDAFAREMAARAQATERLKQLTTSITDGLTQRQAIIHAIADWVRKHLRYSASYLGPSAGWVPRDIETILETGQGDCKDVALVLITMLRLHGIEAIPALVSLGNEYELLPVGAPQFTHVLVQVPQESLFLDTTSPDLPAGQLPLSLLDKPVVLSRPQGSVTSRIPAPQPSDFAIESRGDYALDAAGRLKGRVSVGFGGQLAWQAHSLVERIPAHSDGSHAMTKMLAQSRLSGQGTLETRFDSSAPRQDITANVEIEDFLAGSDVASLGASPPVPFMAYSLKERLAARGLAGPRATSGICLPAKVQERFTVNFAPGTRILRLPPGEEIEGAALRFSSRYASNGRAVIVERDYLYEPPSIVCSAKERQQAEAAWVRIMRDLNGSIIIEREGAAAAPVKPSLAAARRGLRQARP